MGCLWSQTKGKGVAKSLLAKYLEHHGQSPDPDATALEIWLEQSGNQYRREKKNKVCMRTSRTRSSSSLKAGNIYKTHRRWLDFLYVVGVTTRSTNFVLVILVVGNQFKISSLIVTRKGNHVMYIGHVYAQVGVLFLLSKGLVRLITSVRQTDKDQRIKIEERSGRKLGT